MKIQMALIALLIMVSVAGCAKKESMTITGPSGQKASVSFNQ